MAKKEIFQKGDHVVFISDVRETEVFVYVRHDATAVYLYDKEGRLNMFPWVSCSRMVEYRDESQS